MLKSILLTVIAFTLTTLSFGQQALPILKTNADVLSIKDGDELRTDYWYLDASIDLDVYVADKLNRAKLVTFYSDIDSLSFLLKPMESCNFIVLLNEKDTFLTQLKSGILSRNDQALKPQRDTIPFTLNAANNMMIEAVINDVDTVLLMFHTSESTVGVTQEASQKIKSLTFNDTHDAKSWGGGGSTRYAQGNRLQIGNFKWEGQTIWEGKYSGPDTDGKFGPQLFSEKIIEINYDANFIVIHTTLPTISQDYQKVDVKFKQSFMFVESTCIIEDNKHANNFLIHSGFGGALLLDDEFAKKHQFNDQLTIVSESKLKDSYGNILKTKKAILPHLNIDHFKFQDVPVSFFEGAIGRQKMSVLGCSLLKRFNWVFDLQKAELYLRPNQFTNDPFG